MGKTSFNPSDLDLRDAGGDCLLRVRVTPRASRNEIAGTAGGILRLRLQAPPVEGAANEAARDFLADLLGRPRSAVILDKGQTSRDKTFRIAGAASEAVRRALAS
jgi:uncharacterized protein (TIGR00251 family)